MTLNLVRYNKPMFDLVSSFFDDHMRPTLSESGEEYSPLVNIYEKDDIFYLEAQLPGIKKENVKLEIDGDYLSLSAEQCKENEVKSDKYYMKEIAQGKFVRSFRFPQEVDKDKLSAKFEDGILKVELPKKEEIKPEVKQIEIK